MALADFLVVVLVALFAVTVPLLLQRRQAGVRREEQGIGEARRLHDEITELRMRIQVLERVITDTHGSADLSSEIERLRDR